MVVLPIYYFIISKARRDVPPNGIQTEPETRASDEASGGLT